MSGRFLLLILILTVNTGTHAIVIRHDTGYSRYVTSESKFPAVFWLEQRDLRKICVATLIDAQWALTAAHCVEETAMEDHIAAAGPYVVHIAGSLAAIDKVVIHPYYHYRYDESQLDREVDLALLHLVEPLAIPLPVHLYRDSDELYRTVTLLGWGYSGLGTIGIQRDDGRFRQAKNVINSAAERLRFTFDDPRLPDGQAIELEGLPGLGDSGGPALLETTDGWRIAGVAIGEIGALPENPQKQGMYGAIGVYERVSLHLDWIDAVTNGTDWAHAD